jgi:hypothetical protein
MRNSDSKAERFERHVRLTVLGERERTMEARMGPVYGASVRLLVDERVPTSAPVRVDVEDGLMLGETCYSAAVEGGYLVGLVLDQSLSGAASLMKLMDRLMGPELARRANPCDTP